jgi:nucleotide-binding universal stress UspA family protein
MQLRHIVVATDESDAGRQAMRTGLDLSSRSAARLTVMRVVAVKALPLLGAVAVCADASEREDGAAELERLRRWLAPELLAAGRAAHVEVAVTFGDTAAEICRFAETREADLLILGRKLRTPAARLLLGDTADRVLRRSRVPCLFVQPGAPPITQLLVAVDRSPQALRVFAAGRDFAAAAGAAIRVATVEAISAPEIVPDILARTAACDPDVLGFGYDRSDPERFGKRRSTARRLAHAAPLSVLAIPLETEGARP